MPKRGVLKRGKRWFARYTLDCGKEHRGTAHSEWEASIISANMSGRHCPGHSGRRGQSVQRTKPVSLSFESVATEWLHYYPSLGRVRESTMLGYERFTRRHLVPVLGAVPIHELTADHIESFIARKRQGSGKLQDNTLQVGLAALRLILKRAKRRGLISSSPFLDVEWKPAQARVEPDPFTSAELRAIFSAADVIDFHFGTMLRLWAGSGARAGEVTGLQAQDLDLSKGTVLIRRTFSHNRLQAQTKTGRERHVSFLHPVHVDGAGWRPVDIDDLLGRLGKVQSLEPQAFLFGGARPWTASYISRRWQRTLTRAQVRYRVGEQLRHTLASTLLSRGAPITYVSRQGGWRGAGVLLRSYARWIEEAEHVPAEPVEVPRPVHLARQP
jgi:integrase